jgi:hypothetical protein
MNCHFESKDRRCLSIDSCLLQKVIVPGGRQKSYCVCSAGERSNKMIDIYEEE